MVVVVVVCVCVERERERERCLLLEETVHSFRITCGTPRGMEGSELKVEEEMDQH